MSVQGAIQLEVTIDGVSYSIDKKHLSSLNVQRNLGDSANKFTLEVFDETAYQIESAIAGKGQPAISVRYSAANNWRSNDFSSVLFTGVCMDYQMSFVGRATMLSIEGILSAASTVPASVDWWFKKATINWCNADLEYDEITGEAIEIDGHSVEDAAAKSFGGRAFNINDPKDIVCAYLDTKEIITTDSVTGEEIISETEDVYINPARIFRRIIAAFNQAYGNSFGVPEIEECRWVKGLDTIQQDETAAEYINRVLCKNAVTYRNNGSEDLKDQIAGFQYYVDGNGHHFKRLNYMDSNKTNTIELHFGTQDSRVISFSASNVGALVMAGVGTDSYNNLLASSSTTDKLYGESVTVGGENLSTGIGGTIHIDSGMVTSSNYFVDVLQGVKYDGVIPKSSSSADTLSAEYTDAYLKLENMPFEAQLTVWGEYSDEIKPGKFIDLLTYDTNGNKHYTSGTYYITEVMDDVSAQGFIQTLSMIKNISAYSTGSVNADDTTGSNNSDSGESNGAVLYTMPQLETTNNTSPFDTYNKQANLRNMVTDGGGGGR